ncbi:hypothetical protein ACFWQL_18450 [Amycolatopsis thermoflava]|uniref:hypothetical protein n=1 Tax=Amycolatopsis thermoflava TaxID=84480 RepID=UPI003647D05F
MASLFNKIARFANSPQGKCAIRQAQQFANDPRRRAQAKSAIAKLKARVSGHGRRPY